MVSKRRPGENEFLVPNMLILALRYFYLKVDPKNTIIVLNGI